jgi:hypothetical protein
MYSFKEFTAQCITLPARNWKVPPEESTIENIPFILAEHQVAFLDYLKTTISSDKVILKTRQRGYSVMLVAYVLWKVLFGDNENILYLCDREDKAKEFYDLLKKIYYSIPTFLRLNLDIKADRRIKNTAFNNSLSFKVATENAGRSGTFTLVICDEYSYYDESIQESISAALTSSCPNNRIWVSTPKKENDSYHRKVIQAEKDGTLWKHTYWDFIDDWFGSEKNAKAWRKVQEEGLTPQQKARELDCEFKGIATDQIWVIEPQMFIPSNVSEGSTACFSMDLGWSDDTAILLFKEYPQMIHFFDEIVFNKTTIPQIISRLKQRNFRYIWGAADSSSKKTDQVVGTSAHKELQIGLGCRILTHKIPDKHEMYSLAQSALLRGLVKIDYNRCPHLVEMFNNYEWKDGKFPHDKYSHIHDSFVYAILNFLYKSGRKPQKAFTFSKNKLGLQGH